MQCGSAGSDENASLQNKEEGGSARAWPVAAPMPKSDPFSEKRECLDGSVLAFCFRVPFTVGVAMYL